MRPTAASDPIWPVDEMTELIALTPWPTGAGAVPDVLAAADVIATVALSPDVTGRPAITTSAPPVVPSPDDPLVGEERPDAPSSAEGIAALGADESDGGAEDRTVVLAAAPPRLEADRENPPNAADVEPGPELPPPEAPLMRITASTPTASCSVRAALPESMTSLPLAARMLPGSTLPAAASTAIPPVGESDRIPALPARTPFSPEMTTSPLLELYRSTVLASSLICAEP